MSSEKLDYSTPETGSVDELDKPSSYDELSPAEKRRERVFLWKLDLIYCTVAMIAFVFKVSRLEV